MSYKREGDRVTIEISVEQYLSLMLVLGSATGALQRRAGWLGAVDPRAVLRLANAINEGNPNHRPYEVKASEIDPC